MRINLKNCTVGRFFSHDQFHEFSQFFKILLTFSMTFYKINLFVRFFRFFMTFMNPENYFQDQELSLELFQTKRETTTIKNVIDKNISTDTKLSKAQLSNLIQSEEFLVNVLDYLAKKVMSGLAVYLAGDNSPGLASNLA